MKKVLTIILFLISGAFSVKAVDVDVADSLEIYYDGIYAVNWTVNVYPVADIFSFNTSNISDTLEVLDCRQKGPLQRKIIADGGNRLLWYYHDISFEDARSFKSELEKVDLPDGYKWGFGFYENEKQKMTLIIAICELESPFSVPIKQAFFEKDGFGKPSIGFSLLQGESEEALTKYREYRIQHKNNALVIEINGWLFAPTQINQLGIPNTQSITISYVPLVILEELYKPPFNQDTEEIVE
uniref:hypothetical protein n=1 Tax=Bacteroides xylanisolvens TaxID=371601 RepID=UPI0035627201